MEKNYSCGKSKEIEGYGGSECSYSGNCPFGNHKEGKKCNINGMLPYTPQTKQTAEENDISIGETYVGSEIEILEKRF